MNLRSPKAVIEDKPVLGMWVDGIGEYKCPLIMLSIYLPHKRWNAEWYWILPNQKTGKGDIIPVDTPPTGWITLGELAAEFPGPPASSRCQGSRLNYGIPRAQA